MSTDVMPGRRKKIRYLPLRPYTEAPSPKEKIAVVRDSLFLSLSNMARSQGQNKVNDYHTN